jgi:hypothetical protein
VNVNVGNRAGSGFLITIYNPFQFEGLTASVYGVRYTPHFPITTNMCTRI